MPKPRRKTLSHTEIENFLTEISTVTNEINHKVDNFFNLEDINEPSLACLHQVPSSVNKPPSSNADLVREFCKLHFQQNAASENKNDQSKDIAMKLFQNTKYKLITGRLLTPEEFLHPIESTEGKRSLILSLTPMLTDAEEQRKKDTQECEEITRCKSNKIRGKSSYEYIDIDTYQKVDFEEYEMRYMLFINRNKPKKVHLPPQPSTTPHTVLAVRTSTLNPPVPAPVPVSQTAIELIQPPLSVEEDKENNRMRANRQRTTSSTNILLEVDKKQKKKTSDRKRKLTNPNAGQSTSTASSRGGDRRGTLSPASARAMALKAMEEESVKTETPVQSQSFLSPVKTSTVPEVAASTVPFDDIDLIQFEDDIPISLSSREGGRRKSTSCLFTVTEEEIALINGLATSASAPTLPSPSQPLALMPTEPNLPHPKKRSPLLSRTPVKSPLQKLSEHLNDHHHHFVATNAHHKISPVTTPLVHCHSATSATDVELISMESELVSDISALTSNHTRTLDFFSDDVLIPINCSISMQRNHHLSSSSSRTSMMNEDKTSSKVVSPLSVPMNIIEEEETLMMIHDSSPIPSGTVSLTTSTSSTSAYTLEDDISEEISVGKECRHSSSYFLEDLPDLVDEQSIELQAKKRLHERFMIARNQFQWELVSAQAVNSAILRAKSKYASNGGSPACSI